MTRRRYIRLVMACGIQRNKANAMADMARRRGSYAEAYKQHQKAAVTLVAITNAIEQLIRTADAATKTCRRFDAVAQEAKKMEDNNV